MSNHWKKKKKKRIKLCNMRSIMLKILKCWFAVHNETRKGGNNQYQEALRANKCVTFFTRAIWPSIVRFICSRPGPCILTVGVHRKNSWRRLLNRITGRSRIWSKMVPFIIQPQPFALVKPYLEELEQRRQEIKIMIWKWSIVNKNK